MIRFTWLQFRLQAMVAVGLLAVLAVVLAVTGPHLVNLYDTTVAPCAAQHDCSSTTAVLSDTDGPLQIFGDFLLLLLPVLVGMFWGAPLVSREFETGTFRLAWTQSVPRTRWLAAKLGLGAVAAAVVAGLVSLMVTWWSSPVDRVNLDAFDPLKFGVRDITPVGYAAFAFVLGLTAGLLIRRMLPALAVTLVGFVGARLAVNSWVLPRLIAPLHMSRAINRGSNLSFGQRQGVTTLMAQTRGLLPSDWVYSNQILDHAGHAPAGAFLNRACPLSMTTGQPAPTCIPALAARFHQVITFQPASRYWAFQWYETAIFVGLAVLLGGLCFWWIRRPIA